MNIGDILIAVDPCKMIDDDQPTLTVGKEYEITAEDELDIEIIDDEGSEHAFSRKNLSKFFKKKEDE